MLTMSRSCNASDRGSNTTGWKEPYRSSSDPADSVDSSSDQDSDNSSTTGSGSQNHLRNHQNSSFSPPLPCITTHSVSTVIRPERKMPPIDPLQFVKIQNNELCKKAVEQIKLAEKVKITKEKIKEVEEEWQNNLMNWKSKRKLTKNNSEDDSSPRNPNRKTKTFSEILNEKAKSGARIGYNLHRYIDDNDQEIDLTKDGNGDNVVVGEKQQLDYENATTLELAQQHSNQTNVYDNTSATSVIYHRHHHQQQADLFYSDSSSSEDNKNDIVDDKSTTNVVFNTSLLEEFSVKQSISDNQQVETQSVHASPGNTENIAMQKYKPANQSEANLASSKVFVPINEWKSPGSNSQRSRNNSMVDENILQIQNSSFEVDEESEELDEEMERLRLDQEKSFKAKLHTFEILAKQEEEAVKRAAEANQRRKQNRAKKLAAEKSKSLSNIYHSTKTSFSKTPLVASHSASNSSLVVQHQTKDFAAQPSSHSSREKANFLQDFEQDSTFVKQQPMNSIVYNFKDKPITKSSINNSDEPIIQSVKEQKLEQLQSQQIALISKSPVHSSDMNLLAQQPQKQLPKDLINDGQLYQDSTPLSSSLVTTSKIANIIYENVPTPPMAMTMQQQNSEPPSQQLIPAVDSDALRNASQKLMQQQQQIYQNQPLPPQQLTSQMAYKHMNIAPSSLSSSSASSSFSLPSYNNNILDSNSKQPIAFSTMPMAFPEEVGLPSFQQQQQQQKITKTMQTVASSQPEEFDCQMHLYQNQMIINHQPASGEIGGYNYYENGLRDPATDPILCQQQQHLAQPPPQMLSKYMNSQYLYYPKPYSGPPSGNGNAVAMLVHKPIQPQPPIGVPSSGSHPSRIPTHSNRYGPNGYNPNHWLIQEAELRQQSAQQQHQRITSKNSSNVIPNKASSNGHLSVSGKILCSKCGEELGKGCAAMVVESLSLYYHINCFLCSVCNIQLGNGTVGTDVRVRNNKLHCQNCYSNDEAGLKFSRV